MLGSNVLQSLNAMWIGHFLGESALTAASNANILLFFLLGVVFGISMANAIHIGQSIGAKNHELTQRIVGTSAICFVLTSMAVAALAGLWDCVSRIGLRFAGDPFRSRFCERGAKPVQECFAGRVCGERFARERDVR